MSFDFDLLPDRRGSGSTKWSRYPADVLPMWVADTDFPAPPCVTEALRARVEHGIFGYAAVQQSLRACVVARMRDAYGWAIGPEEIVFLPGVVAGFNMALKAFLSKGDTMAVQLPIYPPMLAAAGHWGIERLDLRLEPAAASRGAAAGWEIDIAAFTAGMARSQALLLCHPHNPTGKVFDRAELTMMAEACLAHGTLIISDEIHCDLLFDGRAHVPVASLSPAIADRTITLMAASKTFNIAGLKTAFAIIRDPALRARFDATRLGLVDSINVFGLVATQAAFAGGGAWHQALMAYLQDNRDYLMARVAADLPGISMLAPQSTFLAWLDCTGTGLDDPQRFFLDRARVGLNPGADFDPQARGFVRLNFGCSRSVLAEGLERMGAALRAR